MRDAKALARQAIQKIARNRLARRKADGVHKAVKPAPGRAQIGEQALNLRVIGHVAIKHQLAAELGGELGDAPLELLAHVAESQLGPLRAAGAGNAVGNGAVGQNAGHEQLLARQKTLCHE